MRPSSGMLAVRARVSPSPCPLPSGRGIAEARRPVGHCRRCFMAIRPVDSAPSPWERDEKHRPLREDIRFLGNLLGDILREQAGSAVFDTEEILRQGFKALRNGPEPDAALRDRLLGTV